MPSTFRVDNAVRPAGYRTPSPPRSAIEFFSPNEPSGRHDVASFKAQQTRRGEGNGNSATATGSPNGADAWHTIPSVDSMNVFADIALSTQAQAASAEHLRNKRYRQDSACPPLSSKRARSERLPSPEKTRTHAKMNQRPVTSYDHDATLRLSEANLLLGFSQTIRHAEESRRRDPHSPQVGRGSEYQDTWRRRQSSSSHSNATSPQKIREAAGQPNGQSPNEEPSTIRSALLETERNPDRDPLSLTRAPEQGNISQLKQNLSQSRQKSLKDKPPSPEGAQEKTEGRLEHISDISPSTHISKHCVETKQMEGDELASAAKLLAVADRIIKPTDTPGRTSTETTGKELREPKAKTLATSAVCSACKFTRNSLNIDGDANSTSWISCDGCKSWFHFACAGFKNEREVRAVDKFKCKKCKPIHGATTYVRKSARAHNAIDYAGLHQGVFKTSDDKLEHHYIQPIKDGIITFLPENFARMHPSLVTADFFEKSGGMKEPVVIPAHLNPRPPPVLHSKVDTQSNPADQEAIKAENITTATEANEEHVLEEGQDDLDMVIPHGLTVRQVAELYGPDEKIEVIDVKSQNGENRKWNMRKWAEYYENPNSKVVRNVISLEVSQSKLGRLIRRPKVVRDLDLQDSVWPEELLAKGEYPRVQFYCLMSVADCFTDFHIDFGGSSVFYHIIKGKKTFLFIPPKEKHLKKYEEWCMSPAQNWTFLADQTNECYRVDLSEGDTMLIPSGWIHAVWTPEDSLVIGGNFLTRMSFAMQLRVTQLEKATGVARKFRYPHFQKLQWFTAIRYLEDDPLPESVKETLYRGETFDRVQPTYFDFDAWGENSHHGRENYHAKYYSQPELDGFLDLTRYLLRTALIDAGSITDGITAETRNAVKKSIPRGHGEPLELVKTFAAWTAWKRGNESIPHWAYPDAEPETLVPDKLSAAAAKKLDRAAAREAALQAPRRQSSRHQADHQATPVPSTAAPQQLIAVEIPAPSFTAKALLNLNTSSEQPIAVEHESSQPPESTPSNAGSVSSRKTACDACRKRRRACKHRDSTSIPSPGHGNTVSTTENGAFRDDTSPLSQFQYSNAIMTSAFSNSSPSRPNIFSSIFDSRPSELDSFILNNTDMMAPIERSLELGSSVNGSATARPRTKACNECRKSKRRCIHDAFGNEDPAKIAEQAIPRPHARKSRKSNESNAGGGPQQAGFDLVLEQPDSHASNIGNRKEIESNDRVEAKSVEAPEVHDSKKDQIGTEAKEGPPALAQTADSTLVAKETITSEQVKASDADEMGNTIYDTTTTQVPLEAKIVNPRSRSNSQNGNPIELSAGHTSFLMSPPASSHDDVGNSPTNGAATHTPSPPSRSRQTSQQPPEPQSTQDQQQSVAEKQHTPESGTFRRTTSSTPVEHVATDNAIVDLATDASKTPSSTTSLHNMSSKQRRDSNRASSATGNTLAEIADEESRKLIKELQAQDLGLRRRAARS